MKRDVLRELNNKTMSLADVEEFYDEIMSSDAASDIQQLMGLTTIEWTAYCHGAGFDELAEWRSRGWPTSCWICGNSIHPEEYGWTILESMDGRDTLVHIACRARRMTDVH